MTPPASDLTIRPLDPTAEREVEEVAARMRLTLIEVLGEERGRSLYAMDWLRARVRWHLDPESCDGQVFLAEHGQGKVIGHTIVRVEDAGGPVGLFSTTWVAPDHRGRGVATALVERGEAWMAARDLTTFVTYTAADNGKLIGLFTGRGYGSEPAGDAMVRLARRRPTAPR